MNRNNILIIPFFLLTVLSCNLKKDKVSNKNDEYSLEFKKSISIKSDSLLRPLFFRSQYLWDKNYLIHSNGSNKLVIFDLNQNNITEVIKFKKQGVNNVNKANLNFYYHNNDSIFLISNQKKYYLTNNKAKIVNSFRFDSVNGNSNKFGEPMLSMGSSNAYYEESTIKFITYPTSPENLNESKNDPVYISLNLDTNEITESDLKYNYSYKYDKLQHPFLIEPLSVANDKGEFVVLFKTNNEFIVTDQNLIKEKKTFDSEYFTEYSSMENPSQIPTFNIESYSNKKLLFDHHEKKYYLFISHYLDYKNPNTGKINTTFSKPFSLLVFDNEFNKLMENKYSGGKYNVNMSFISKNGLYLSLNNPHNDSSFTDDYFKYEVFNLKQNAIQ